MTYPPQPGGWQDPAGGHVEPANGQPTYIDPTSGQPATVSPTPPYPPQPYPPQPPAYPTSGQPAYGPPAYPASGQPAYGAPEQQPYGAPGQPAYGPPGSPASGQPAYDTPTYPASGQPAYGTPEQQPYGAPGQPAYGPPGSPASGQPAYGAPGQPAYAGYQTPYPAYGVPVNSPKNNGMSIASLIVSLVGLVSLPCYGVGGIVIGAVGAILGHVGRKQIRERGEAGGGMATAGVIIGWIAVGLGLIILAVVIYFIVWAVKTGNSYNNVPDPYAT
jgi:hypothetical protein